MGNWRDTTLGHLLRIKHGFAFLGEHFSDAGSHVVLTPGNFNERGGFRSKGDKEKWYRGPIPPDYVLHRGDVLVAMTEQAEGLLGSSAIVPEDGLYLHNQRLGLVDVRDGADRAFVYHLFNTPAVREQIRASASGTKVRHTSPTRIEAVRVRVPEIAEQRRIAGILSAYDDLIENCERRIRVLDEMARALYREWFVLFRYPGHEKTPLVDSALGRIPRGWAVQPLGELAALTMGLSPKGDTYNTDGDGTPLINGPVEFGTRLPVKVKWTTAPSKICKEGDLIVCVRGSTTGKSVKSDGQYCLGRGVCAISSQHQCFVDLLFASELPRLLAQTSGSTFPSWTGPQLQSHPVLSPPKELRTGFEAVVRPMISLVLQMSRQTDTLRCSRDILLPRLLSGQLSVEDAA